MKADDIKHAFDYGIDIRRKHIFLSGEIDSGTAQRVQVACSLIDCEGGEVMVSINSCGGAVYDALAIFDTLRGCKARVKTLGVGNVMSMAACVLQAGDERVLTKNCTVMLHSISDDPGWDYIANQLRNANEGVRLMRRYAEIVGTPMGLKPSEFIRRYEKSTFLDADTAVSVGLADRVL